MFEDADSPVEGATDHLFSVFHLFTTDHLRPGCYLFICQVKKKNPVQIHNVKNSYNVKSSVFIRIDKIIHDFLYEVQIVFGLSWLPCISRS